VISETGSAWPDRGFLGLLRAVAIVAVVVGAAGSLGFLLRAGRSTPVVLLLLFVGWVLLPFVALAWAVIRSKNWSVLTRTTLYGVMVVVTLGSLAAYGGFVAMLRGARPAAVFLMVPLASWLLMMIPVSIAAFASGRMSRPA
jgi:hypothetical protein